MQFHCFHLPSLSIRTVVSEGLGVGETHSGVQLISEGQVGEVDIKSDL